MRIKLVEEKIFTVPDILVGEFRSRMEKGEDLDELISDVECRWGFDEAKMLSVEEVLDESES